MVRVLEMDPFDRAPAYTSGEKVEVVPRQELEQSRPDRHLLVVDVEGRLCARASCWWRETPALPDSRVGLVGHYAAAAADAAATLLAAATARLAAEGCTIAVGPMDGSTWRRYRFVIERGPEPPFFLEPDNADAAPGQFEAAGFRPIATYISALNADLGRDEPGLDDLRQRFATNGIVIRPFAPGAAETELRRIFELSLETFRHNFLYTPIAEAEFLEMNRRLLPVIRPELVLLAFRADRLIGFLFALPDVLESGRSVTPRTIVIKTVAVAAGRANAGLGRLLVGLAHREARRLGFGRAIHALMHEDNVSRNISRRSATTMRRYALYGRRLGG